MKKAIVFTAFILLAFNLFAQNEAAAAENTHPVKNMSLSIGPEWNMNALENFAAGAVIGFDCHFLDIFAAGQPHCLTADSGPVSVCL